MAFKVEGVVDRCHDPPGSLRQYLTRSLKTANFNEEKRLAPAVLAEFNNIIEQARLHFERAAGRDATLAELAHLDTLPILH
jgi:hypothetical protein